MQEFAYCLTEEQIAAQRLNTVLELLDPRMLLYGTKDREVRAVYDMGVEIPIIARCPHLEDLERVTIGAGYAVACRGYVRFGAVPAGLVTGDLA